MSARASDAQATDTAVDIYARYLPDIIIEKVTSGTLAEHEASVETFPCVVMFADISGFTALTERLSAAGADGTENLTQTLNDYFTALIDIVVRHGGDVVKFAGDALIAVWRDRNDDGHLQLAGWRAAQCAMRVQESLCDYSAGGVDLKLRIALGAGPVLIAHIGGVFNRWEFIISGQPLEQVGRIGDHIEPGTVGISTELLELLDANPNAHAQTTPLTDDYVLLTSVDEANFVAVTERERLDRGHEKALRNYLPNAIVHRIADGQNEFLGELRTLSVIFANLPDIHYYTPLETAQALMRELQRSCYRFEGSINKLSVDDKGVSLLAACGLPPMAHEDDPARAVKAALAMSEAVAALGLRCSIGIATGRVYCGAVGSSMRREYTIMGDTVNLAARLMQHADGAILVDTDTQRRAGRGITFEEPVSLTLKGKAEPVAAWRPTGFDEQALDTDDAGLIGRVREREMLAERLGALVEHREDAFVVLEGDAGMGKSRITEDFLGHARDSSVDLFVAAADAIERSTSYYVWQQLLLQMLGLEGTPPGERAAVVLARLGELGIGDYAPLLEDILALGLEDNTFTAQLGGEVRAANTRNVVVDILRSAGTYPDKLIVIDDAHWMDSASWALLGRITQDVHPLMVLIVTRPVSEPLPEYAALRGAGTSEVITLDTMSGAEITELVCHRLGVEALPDAARS